jgi:hypothetical protein
VKTDWFRNHHDISEEVRNIGGHAREAPSIGRNRCLQLSEQVTDHIATDDSLLRPYPALGQIRNSALNYIGSVDRFRTNYNWNSRFPAADITSESSLPALVVRYCPGPSPMCLTPHDC